MVEQEQLAVARARFGLGVTLTGPMYQQPLSDSIHADNLGRMMGGEVDALAYHWAVTKGEDFHPLWPVAGGVTRTGTEVRVPFALPLGTSALRIDDDWVLTVPDAGFIWTDDGAGVGIASVAIDGTEVVITLDGDPGVTTSETLEYAIFNAPDDTGWASGRGLIYADSGQPSVYYRRGFAVPPTIRHYSVRFKEILA